MRSPGGYQADIDRRIDIEIKPALQDIPVFETGILVGYLLNPRACIFDYLTI